MWTLEVVWCNLWIQLVLKVDYMIIHDLNPRCRLCGRILLQWEEENGDLCYACLHGIPSESPPWHTDPQLSCIVAHVGNLLTKCIAVARIMPVLTAEIRDGEEGSHTSRLNSWKHLGRNMVSQKSLTQAAMSGVALSILFAVSNGLSTYILPDGQTLNEWVETKVGA